MKTPQQKLDLAMKLTKAQSDLLALHYKLDRTEYTNDQLKRFDRLEQIRDEAIEDLKNSCCTCEDYGIIRERNCPIHVKANETIKEKTNRIIRCCA